MQSFPDADVDEYLAELINMYLHMPEVSEVIQPYLKLRSKNNTIFALQTSWMLDAELLEGNLSAQEYKNGKKLLQFISDEQGKVEKLVALLVFLVVATLDDFLWSVLGALSRNFSQSHAIIISKPSQK